MTRPSCHVYIIHTDFGACQGALEISHSTAILHLLTTILRDNTASYVVIRTSFFMHLEHIFQAILPCLLRFSAEIWCRTVGIDLLPRYLVTFLHDQRRPPEAGGRHGSCSHGVRVLQRPSPLEGCGTCFAMVPRMSFLDDSLSFYLSVLPFPFSTPYPGSTSCESPDVGRKGGSENECYQVDQERY